MTSRILVIEPRSEGHFLFYSELIIQSLLDCYEITLLTGTDATQKADFHSRIVAPLKGASNPTGFQIASTLPSFNWSKPTHSWKLMLKDINQTIIQQSPSVVIVPSAEYFERALLGLGNSQRKFRQLCKSIRVILGKPMTIPTKDIKSRLKKTQRKLTDASGSLALKTDVMLTNIPSMQDEKRTEKNGNLWKLVPEPSINANAIQLDRESAKKALNLDAKRPTLILAGVLSSPHKNLRYLCKQYQAIDNHNKPCLLLAGNLSDADSVWVKEEFKDEIASNSLVFYAYQTEKELCTCIAAADLTIIPYTSHYYTSSIASKSVALGTPILAPECGWLKELVDATRCGYFWGEALDLKKAWERIGNMVSNQSNSSHYRHYARYSSTQNYGHILRDIIAEQLGNATSNPPASFHWHKTA